MQPEPAQPPPAQPPPAQPWVQFTPCGGCGQPVDPTRATYNKQGELVCKGCESAEMITEGYLRAARSSSGSALGIAVVSLIFNPFYIFSIVAIVGAIRAIALINRPEYRAALGTRHTGMMLMALGGLFLGLVRPGMLALVLLGAAAGG